MTPFAKLMLEALGYAKEVPDPADEEALRQLVVWLEDHKIRALKKDERQHIRDTKSPQWPTTFAGYLDELSCPVTYGPKTRAQVMEWLLAHAVSYECEDRQSDILSMQKAAEASAPTAAPPEVLKELNSKEFRTELGRIASALGVSSTEPSEQARAIRSALQSRRVTPENFSADDIGPANFPSGIEMGDDALDHGARILRMLFVKDLRDLQTLIDESIVEAQGFTANPRTDAKLGKVGR